ncbi:hypothetical protein TNCV_2788141 [Trichonephila clavipes]|uniref:Uncharacterized protein n=1 Tax=Trichonephila clavipes TaxID=2585209 RepID=A0A8X6SWI5_TRICX|nr:hypothetical protein TNCV_2788141 [Trichonephila clavipes]
MTHAQSTEEDRVVTGRCVRGSLSTCHDGRQTWDDNMIANGKYRGVQLRWRIYGHVARNFPRSFVRSLRNHHLFYRLPVQDEEEEQNQSN